jgi:hypothetical protein
LQLAHGARGASDGFEKRASLEVRGAHREYKRNGTANLVIVLDVHRSWRRVKVTESRKNMWRIPQVEGEDVARRESRSDSANASAACTRVHSRACLYIESCAEIGVPERT